MRFCKNHPSKIAVNNCANCEEYFCEDCLILDSGKYYCNKYKCLNKLNESKFPESKSESLPSIKIVVYVATFFLAVISPIIYDKYVKPLFTTKTVYLETAKWHILSLKKWDIILEAPFELVKSEPNISKKVEHLYPSSDAYSYEDGNMRIQLQLMEIPPDIKPDLIAGIKNGFLKMSQVKRTDNVNYHVKDYNILNAEGKKATGSCYIDDSKYNLTMLIFYRDVRIYAIAIMHKADMAEYSPIFDKIVNSIKFY